MKVLLHVCCGPCSLMCVQSLRDEGFDVTGYFANPNIHPVSEYLQRRETMQEAASKMHLPMIWQDDSYNLSGWLAMVYQLNIADNLDGARCRYCYESRLGLTAATAAIRSFDAFCTSLLYSKYQRHDDIRSIGEKIAHHIDQYAPKTDQSPIFLYRDFRPLWQAGVDLSKEWRLYRQKYCACIFSEADRYAKKLEKLQKNCEIVSSHN